MVVSRDPSARLIHAGTRGHGVSIWRMGRQMRTRTKSGRPRGVEHRLPVRTLVTRRIDHATVPGSATKAALLKSLALARKLG